MSSRKKSSTISLMFTQITNNKPTLSSRGDFPCTKASGALTSHQPHGRRGLCVLSPTARMREVRLAGRGLPTLGERLDSNHSSGFRLFSANRTVSQGGRESTTQPTAAKPLGRTPVPLRARRVSPKCFTAWRLPPRASWAWLLLGPGRQARASLLQSIRDSPQCLSVSPLLY